MSFFGRLLYGLGAGTFGSIRDLGQLTLLMGRTVRRMFSRKFEWGELMRQIEYLAINSLTITVLTALSSGMVFALQFAVGLEKFGGKEYVSIVVAIAMLRELGPVLTSVVVGGRVGAGIAAELGSMNVTEQVDAIRALGADPIQKLVVPRTVAMLIGLPFLTLFADIIGIIGGCLISWLNLGLSPGSYLSDSIHGINLTDLLAGLTKTFFFGFGISQISCYMGLNTTGGTEGVGQSTTKTVVISLIFIFLSDFVLTKAILLIE